MGWFNLDDQEFSPSSGMVIQRILDGVSVATSQAPTGTGEAGSIQIELGPAVNTALDPVSLLVDGTLNINKSGTYRIKVSATFGRSGTGGVAKIRLGAFINGVQAGLTVGGDLPSQNTELLLVDEAWLTLPAGVSITYRVMRDSSGVDDGGLLKPTLTSATAPSWNDTTCAAIRVERWVAA